MKKSYKAFIIVLIAWIVSLLAVYIPTSKWMPPTFPLTINNHTLPLFIASTSLASSVSLYLGLDKLRAKP